jgi:hypothetical protein
MDEKARATGSNDDAEIQAHEELQCYTLAHGSRDFIHQHVVDAWAAQHADAQTKPMALAFALVGLYLHVERGASGRRVQQVHMALSRQKRDWPVMVLPEERGELTVGDVMAAPTGPERDRAIDAWCESVWNAFSENRQPVRHLVEPAWRSNQTS